MKINDFLDELNKINRVYRELIVTSNYKQVGTFEVSWDNYLPGIYKNLYAKEYETLLQNRQYSFLLSNKAGFIQFYFKYVDEDNIDKIKMSYYPYPVKLQDESDDLESYVNDSNDTLLTEYYFDLWNLLNQEFSVPLVGEEKLLEFISLVKLEFNIEIDENEFLLQQFNRKYKITNSSHIRIDFDSKVDSHHKCEIQVGAVNYIRLPVDRIISPFIFFDFIIKNLYKDEHQGISSKSNFPTDFSISRKKAFQYCKFIENNIYITHLD